MAVKQALSRKPTKALAAIGKGDGKTILIAMPNLRKHLQKRTMVWMWTSANPLTCSRARQGCAILFGHHKLTITWTCHGDLKTTYT